jgi:hypothetical protein
MEVHFTTTDTDNTTRTGPEKKVLLEGGGDYVPVGMGVGIVADDPDD